MNPWYCCGKCGSFYLYIKDLARLENGMGAKGIQLCLENIVCLWRFGAKFLLEINHRPNDQLHHFLLLQVNR